MDTYKLIVEYEHKAWALVKDGEMSRKAKEETSDELTNIIRQQQAEIERLNKISSETIYELTTTQLKLDSALQTIEAYKPMEQEIERLNRAYEVMNRAMHLIWHKSNDKYAMVTADEALTEAHRVKDGMDGEQG